MVAVGHVEARAGHDQHVLRLQQFQREGVVVEALRRRAGDAGEHVQSAARTVPGPASARRGRPAATRASPWRRAAGCGIRVPRKWLRWGTLKVEPGTTSTSGVSSSSSAEAWSAKLSAAAPVMPGNAYSAPAGATSLRCSLAAQLSTTARRASYSRPPGWHSSVMVSAPCSAASIANCPGTFAHSRSAPRRRVEEHTSELKSLIRIQYAVFDF